MTSGLIVALDFSSKTDAYALIKQIDPSTCALKIGLEMFTTFGPNFVQELVAGGYKVFLDLKFHDIPNTVSKACHAAAKLGVWMINVHASGGLLMMQAAKKAVDCYAGKRPLLIAVTVLTSMSASELPLIGLNKSLEDQVIDLALLAQSAGLDGVVCSAHEVSAIKSQCGKQFLTITPGIRLDDNHSDDQTRIMTPQKAARLGSDFLVIGRPITKAPNPSATIEQIRQAIHPIRQKNQY